MQGALQARDRADARERAGMETPEFWRWVWLVIAVVFAAGEMSTPGSFFLLPFAIGAAVAALLGFMGVSVAIEWVAFVLVSGGCFLAFRPLARRLDLKESAEGIGSKRLIGQEAIVLEAIGEHELGLIRVHREEWRAESEDATAIPAGTKVRVVEVRGTRCVVYPVESPSELTSPPPDPDGAEQ